MHRLAIVSLLLVLALLSAQPAVALVLGLDWGLGQATAHVNYNGQSLNVWAGKMAAYLGGTLGNPLPPNDGQFHGYVYCVDLDHWITLPTEYEVTQETTASIAHGDRVAWLYRTYLSVATTQTKAAALQLAIWEVLVDDGDGFSAGNFRYTGGLPSATGSEAQNMIAASVGKSSTSAMVLRSTGSYGQSMLATPVPEPSSLILVGLGLGFSIAGVLAARRRG